MPFTSAKSAVSTLFTPRDSPGGPGYQAPHAGNHYHRETKNRADLYLGNKFSAHSGYLQVSLVTFSGRK
jgi:hypothetical protein